MIIRLIKEHKNRICYLFSFIIPVLFMLVISISLGFYPFGRLSILVGDLRYQFVDYYGYMKSIFFGNNDFFYTFSKTFGGDMLGFSFYYLGNPLALILLLFPNDILPAGVLFMIMLFMGLSGFTFNYFINHVFEHRWASLMYSTAYAFMGYYVAYINCTIYFYNVMLLPLIVLGLYRTVQKKKISYLYVITLFLSIVANYYMGYMACLFSVIIFCFFTLNRVNGIKEIRNEKKTIIAYFFGSLIAVGMSAFSLIPVLMSLRGEKTMSFFSEAFSLSRNFKMRDVFSGLYTSAFHGNISDGLPIIYCGVLTVVFLFYYFSNSKISNKEKVLAFSAIVIMLFGFYFDSFNVIWHGFAHPIGFPYRNSYILSFLFLYFSYKGFTHINDGIRFRQCIVVLAIFAVYSLYLILSHNEYAGINQVVVSGAIVVLTLFFIYGFNYKKEFVIPIIFGLFLIQGLDLIYNGYLSIKAYFPGLEEDFEGYSIDAYSDFVKETGDIISAITEEDKDLYRIEKMYRRTHNDAMLLAYNGLSHFSSCETKQVKDFMERLGFRNTDLWAFYGESNTAFADSLFGIRYLLSQYDENPKPYEICMEMGEEDDEKYVFRNPYALPFMFGSTDDVVNVTYTEEHHFDYQNDVAKSIAGKDYMIYRPVTDEKIELVNLTKDGNTYIKINPNEEAYISIKFVADNRDFIYMYLNAPSRQKTRLTVNDLEKQDYFTDYGWSVRELGHFHDDEDVDFRIYLLQDSVELSSYELYYEHRVGLEDWYDKVVGKADCTLIKETSSHLTGTIDSVSADRLVFTIPYEKDWIVKLDGQRVETEKVLDALLSVRITPGKHSIDMRYIPRGIIYGIPISLISLIILIAVKYYEFRYILYRRN